MADIIPNSSLFPSSYTVSLNGHLSSRHTSWLCVSQDKGSQAQPFLVLRLCSLRLWLSIRGVTSCSGFEWRKG